VLDSKRVEAFLRLQRRSRIMKIEIAAHAGYCYGVKRAFDQIKEVPQDAEGNIYTLGPIIHNPQAVEALKKEKGVKPVKDLDEIAEGTVVVRTHGLPPQILARARAKGLGIIDATCPHVTAAQQRARELVEDGYSLIILGERNHPEVVGILAHAQGEGVVVEEPGDLESIGRLKKVGLVVQSTQELEKLAEVAGRLSGRCQELKIYNTICSATVDRQSAARALARRADVMVVVGGRNSGNTRRLGHVCEKEGKPTYHIESAGDLDPSWFDGAELVGVTAGASTPDFVLREVVGSLEKLGGTSS
jgi:4-hydroxy-3-methylbut-2-enyl diphosphate reductase